MVSATVMEKVVLARRLPSVASTVTFHERPPWMKSGRKVNRRDGSLHRAPGG